ncbi:MAG: sulfate adenylyltransferase subunit CysN [Planctomycetaceae bacterium]|nr:sulfate adenylyltransferase subunit CysN [Planctomycetaceae bacterium]
MSHQSELIASDIDAYLAQHEQKELLRFITCGSVDDGKSTLIGRLLYDSKMIYEDQLAKLQKDSVTHGTTGGEFDPALLTDGLRAEREQGITIDVAYRYFSTAKRKFIIADTPGHVQYTRNMATGASTADLAIILIDARHGVMEQTRRHSFIVSLLGIKHILVAINKMDLLNFDQAIYEQIRADYLEFATRLSIPDLHFIPISALKGDNLVDRSTKMPWYNGPTLMEFLENVYIGSDRNLEDFRFPVQYVNRPHLDFRGFCGTVASGVVRVGDEIMAVPSRKTSRVKEIVTFDGNVSEAFAPLSVTLTLTDEVDISRGDMIVRPGNVPTVGSKFEAMLVWMSDEPMLPGKNYLIKHCTKSVSGQIQQLKYQVDVNSLQRVDASRLELNQIGRCVIQLTETIAYDDYRRNRGMGGFIVIDRITNATVGAGMIHPRHTSEDRPDHWDNAGIETLQVDQSHVGAAQREIRYGQKPVTILLTGVPGAGKTSTALALEKAWFDEGRTVVSLDGEQMRAGLSRDLDFSPEHRSENLRRAAEVAKLINDSGLICILSMVAPSEEIRQKAADLVGRSRFLIVHLHADEAICRQRDQEGHYRDDRPSLNYEAPVAPDLKIDTATTDPATVVQLVRQLVHVRGYLS